MSQTESSTMALTQSLENCKDHMEQMGDLFIEAISQRDVENTMLAVERDGWQEAAGDWKRAADDWKQLACDATAILTVAVASDKQRVLLLVVVIAVLGALCWKLLDVHNKPVTAAA
jgi:hypothetical protein